MFHVMIRDEKGRKMSKSLGNSPDPFYLIDKYGADALRFGLLLITPREQDVLYSEERIKVGRNFTNKLWNSARLLASLAEGASAEIPAQPTPEERWMLARLARAASEARDMIAGHDLYSGAKYLYNFFWHEFCDWGLEFAKLAKREQGRCVSTALYVFSASLAMLHPFMPFITEELWERFSFAPNRLYRDSWPHVPAEFSKPVPEIDGLVDLVTAVRTMRAELGIAAETEVSVEILTSDDTVFKSFQDNMIYLKGLSRIPVVKRVETKPHPATGAVLGWGQVYLPLSELISRGKLNIEAEHSRISKEVGKLGTEIERIEGKLKNKSFLSKAPDEIVSAERERLDSYKTKITRLRELLEGLR